MKLTDEELEKELSTAIHKANDSLGKYKFQMFGYWSSYWVKLNHLHKLKRPNPWKDLVQFARHK